MKKTFWLLSAIFSIAIMASTSRGAGVTVITHGYESVFQGYPSWVDSMAQAITNAAGQKGLKTAWYHLQVVGSPLTQLTGILNLKSATTAEAADEIVLTVDWSYFADHFGLAQIGEHVESPDIAAVIANNLLTANQSGFYLASRPLHFIGHSRGGSVMLETAKILGSYGVWVDHVTTLDPHPLVSTDPLYVPFTAQPDPTPTLYENVVFADNYWQSDYIPMGQNMDGAENNKIDFSSVIHTFAHIFVHEWYHGTIDAGGVYPTNDGMNGVGGDNIPDS